MAPPHRRAPVAPDGGTDEGGRRRRYDNTNRRDGGDEGYTFRKRREAREAEQQHYADGRGGPADVDGGHHRRRRDREGGLDDRRHTHAHDNSHGQSHGHGHDRWSNDERRDDDGTREGPCVDDEAVLARTIRRLADDDPSLTSIDWGRGGRRRHREPEVVPVDPVGPRGGARLAAALHRNSTLASLRLDGHGIGDAGAASFLVLPPSDAVGSGNDDGRRGSAQQHSALSELRLRDNGIGPRGAEALSMLLVDEDAAEQCENCRARGSSRGSGSASGENEEPSAPCLSSPENSVTCRRPSPIAGVTPVLPNLVRLDLSGNPLGPAGVRDLSASLLHGVGGTALSTLVLSSVQAGDDGACRLAHLLRNNASLSALRLRNNGITGMGACAVMHALWDNTTLVELDLSDNADVGESGGVAAGDMLGQNGTVTWLRMGRCGLGDLAAVAIARGLERAATSSGGGGEADSGSNSSSSSKSSSSRALRRPWRSSSFSPLAVLDLSGNDITSDGVTELCSALRFSAATPSSSLHRLDLSGNLELGDAGAYTLSDILRAAGAGPSFSLRELSLRNCGIGEGGIVALGQGAMHCASLEALELGGNDGIEDGMNDGGEVAASLRSMLMGPHGTLRRLDLGRE